MDGWMDGEEHGGIQSIMGYRVWLQADRPVGGGMPQEGGQGRRGAGATQAEAGPGALCCAGWVRTAASALALLSECIAMVANIRKSRRWMSI